MTLEALAVAGTAKSQEQDVENLPANTKCDRLLRHCHFSCTRTQLKYHTRCLCKSYKQQLVKNLSDNLKTFWQYVHSGLTTRTRVDDLVTENGDLASTDEAKAKTLADAYSKVFYWNEDLTNVPVMNLQYGGTLLEDLQVSAEQVKGKLCSLCPTVSPGPAAIRPKVLS